MHPLSNGKPLKVVCMIDLFPMKVLSTTIHIVLAFITLLVYCQPFSVPYQYRARIGELDNSGQCSINNGINRSCNKDRYIKETCRVSPKILVDIALFLKLVRVLT